MAYDAFLGRGAHVRANRFRERHGFQKSTRFSVTLFDDNVACWLAKAWCSRPQFFFDEFQDSGNDSHMFDERAGEGWVPPADFASIQTGADAFAQARCAQIRFDHASVPCVKCSCVRACRCRCMTTTMTCHHLDMTALEATYYHRGMPQTRNHKRTSEV